jgi:hypothetical protein
MNSVRRRRDVRVGNVHFGRGSGASIEKDERRVKVTRDEVGGRKKHTREGLGRKRGKERGDV